MDVSKRGPACIGLALLFALLLFGCAEKDVMSAEEATKLPEIQAFTQTHAQYRMNIFRLTASETGKDEYAHACQPPLPEEPHYRITLSDPDRDERKIVWVGMHTKEVTCTLFQKAQENPQPVAPVDQNAIQKDAAPAKSSETDQEPEPAPAGKEPQKDAGPADAGQAGPAPAAPPEQAAEDDKAPETAPKSTTQADTNGETPITATCADTDDNVNYYQQGTMTWTDATGTASQKDFCFNDTVLIEHYCKKSASKQLTITCPANMACEQGACVPMQADVPEAPECGNQSVETDEQCDGGDLAGQNCTTLGFESGELSCTAECTFDTSACQESEPGNEPGPVPCGNGTCDAGETLTSCPTDCKCGNGVIDTGEQCDGFALGGATCQSNGFDEGELACHASGANQCTYDTGACTFFSCQNGVAEGNEQCDGADLRGETCTSQGFAGGGLFCTGQCTFDTSACTLCGNGTIDANEQCDGTNLNARTCTTQGYTGGTLGCTGQCRFDTASCTLSLENLSADQCQQNGADLDVLTISRTPRYERYRVAYLTDQRMCTYPYTEDRGPYACNANEKHWPAPGETVTFRARVANRGNTDAPAATYAWRVDGEDMETGTLPALEPCQAVTLTHEWVWQDGEHTLALETDAQNAIGDAYRANNRRDQRTNALTFRILVSEEFYAAFGERTNVAGTKSFEDWIQAQFARMQEMFADAGIQERIVLDTLIVADRATIQQIVDSQSGLYEYDGQWTFYGIHPDFYATLGKTSGFSDADYAAYAEYYFDRFGNGYDYGLIHELGHQLGLIDEYNLNYDWNYVNNNEIITGVDGAKRVHYAADTHLTTMNACMECGFSYHAVGALNANKGHRRGFFGEYQFDMPQTSQLRVLDSANNPLGGAALSVYRVMLSEGEPGVGPPALATGTTDAQGIYTLPNQSAPQNTTATGHTLHDNPFGNINVVGHQNLLLVRAEKSEVVRYGWVDISRFNQKYWQGQTGTATVDLRTGTIAELPLERYTTSTSFT